MVLRGLDQGKSGRERAILDRFRHGYKEFPKGKLIKSESPDFILKISPKKSIGIELTAMPALSYRSDADPIDGFWGTIISCVRKKEEKLTVYRKRWANEYWLVVYADSTEFRVKTISKWNMAFELETGFDRIFLLDLFEGKVWDFKLKRE